MEFCVGQGKKRRNPWWIASIFDADPAQNYGFSGDIALRSVAQRSVLFVSKLVLLVADVACLCRIKAQVADGSYQGVNAKGQV